MIVFFVFLFAFVPSKTVMISLGDDRLVMLEKDRNFLLTKRISIYSVRFFELILFASDCYAISSDCRNFSEFLKYRSIRNILIATDWSTVNTFCFCCVGCLF